MIEQLLRVSTTELNDLVLALRAERLCPPYTHVSLQRVLSGGAAEAIAAEMQKLADAGFTPRQIATTFDLIARDRRGRPFLEDQLDLVTTGLEVQGVSNRDTSVVVRELFTNASESVLLAGYAIYQGQRVFQALADRMQDRPELQVRVVVDVQRSSGDTTAHSVLVRRFAERFRTQQWPPDRPLPAVFYDPRSLELGGDKRACMHAKCVVVDRQIIFVSSANFTEAAQQRNIEAGLLVRSAAIADRLTRFFDALINDHLLISVPL